MVDRIVVEVPHFYKVVALEPMRATKGVVFDSIPMEQLQSIHGIDRVFHEAGAISPSSVGAIERPWYMHPHQVDQLMVLGGERQVEIYSDLYHELVNFTVSAESVYRNGELLYDGAALLVWYTNVFHRIKTASPYGSQTINFATRFDGYDRDHEFDIFDLDTVTGKYKVIREGYLDQP